jgi:HK97 family phage major capsid protein
MNVSVREIKALLTERSALVESYRALPPEDQAAMDAIAAKVAELDARVVALEEAMAGDVISESVDAAVASAPAAEPGRALENLQIRLLEIMEKWTSKRSQAMPIESNDGPGYTRDLNDRRAQRDSNLALRGWLLGNQCTDEQRGAAQRSGLDLRSNTIVIDRLQEQRSASGQTTVSAAGGYTIPAGFLAELERKTLFFNPLRSVARVITTETGNSLPIPCIDDTANTGALGAEVTAATVLDMAFTAVTLGAYRYQSLVLCSNELLQDNGINLASEIGGLLGERIGRSEAAAFATGTGSSQPEGVVTGSSAGITAAGATAITLVDLQGLVNSLDWSYQINGKFMMHQSVWTAILKLQDSQGRPLVADLINGNEPKLFGREVIVNNNMAASIVTTAKTILFGDFQKFIIRDSSQLEITRMNERYAEQYATGFLATGRRDSKVLQSSAIKRLTQA